MRLYLTHASNFDFQNELYTPLRDTLGHRHGIFFPHNNENINTHSKDIIAESDYVLAEVSFPSTGQGIELGWADGAGIPIICFYRSGTAPSSSLKFVSETFIKYESTEDMGPKLLEWFENNPLVRDNQNQGES